MNANNPNSGVNIWNSSNPISKEDFLGAYMSRIEGDENLQREFCDNLYQSNQKIKPEIREKMRDYWTRINPQYASFDFDTVTYKDLINRVNEFYSKLQNARQVAKAVIEDNYKISEGNSNKIIDQINNLNLSHLKEINSSTIKLDKFMSKIYSWNLLNKPKLKSEWNIFKELKVEEKIKGLSKEKQNEIRNILETIWTNPAAIWLYDIEVILSNLVLNDGEKRYLLQKALPTISLKESIELWIFSKFEAKWIKKDFIEEALGATSLEENELEKLSLEFNDKDFIIRTSSLDSKKLLISDLLRSALARETIEQWKFIKEEYKNQLSKNLQEFKTELRKKGITGSEKLTKWAFSKIETIDKEGNRGNFFIEITDDGSESWLFNFANRWTNGKYNAWGLSTTNEGISYKNFLEKLNTWEHGKITNFEVFSRDEFTEMLKKWEIKEDTEEPSFKQPWYYKNLIEERKTKLREDWLNEEAINADTEIIELSSKNEDGTNIETLISWLDSIDSEWINLWLTRWITFSDKKDSFFEVEWISDGMIDIKNIFSNETFSISYSNFYYGFKKWGFHRTSNALNTKDFLKNILSFSWWGWVKIKDNSFIRENEEDDGHGNIIKSTDKFDYLIPPDLMDGDEILKILKVEDGKVLIQFWTAQVKPSQKNLPPYKIESQKYYVTPWFLESWINIHNLQPKKHSNNQVKDIDVPHDHRQWSLMNWWASWFSIQNFLQWLHDIEHSIEHYFEWGQKEQASKVAMGLFSILPYNKIDILWEIRESMRGDVEIEQKKRMDKQIEHLQWVDSWDAIKEILHWLHYSNTPAYKIHAGMMYMMKNYGVLYAKEWLVNLRGSYTWYKALGWEPNDTFFKKVQKDCQKENLPFSEEELVHRYLKLLWEKKLVRSRLHKEFKPLRDESKRSEFEKWKKDGDAIRNLDGRIRGWMWELMGWTYPNALWFLKSWLNKGGNIYKMNLIPFILGFSWIAYEFDPIWMMDAMKNIPSEGWLTVILRFLSYNSDIDLLSDTILEVSRRIWEIEGNSEIYEMALEIHKDRKSSSPKRFDLWTDKFEWYQAKIKRTEAFYNLYWAKITDALYGLLDDNPWEKRSKYSILIRTEKDAGKDLSWKERNEGNTTFRKYYDSLMGFSKEFWYDAKDILNDAFKDTGITWVDSYELTTKVLWLSQAGWFYKWKIAEDAWSSFKNGIITTARNTYNPSSREDDYELKKKEIKHQLRWFISWYFQSHWSQNWVTSAIKKPSSALWYINNWMDMEEIVGIKADVDDMRTGRNQKFELLLEKIAEKVIRYENKTQEKGKWFSDLFQAQDSIQREVNRTIWD